MIENLYAFYINPYNFHVLRGPLIIFTTLSIILLPQLYSTLSKLSSQNLFLLTLMVCGIVITIFDINTYVRMNAKDIWSKTRKFGDTLVLDRVLKDLFAFDGWVSLTWGSWIGTIILYFLPLTKYLRFKIMSYVFGDGEYMNVQRLIFKPGGIWKILPYFVDGNICDDEEEVGEGIVAYGTNKGKDTYHMRDPFMTDLELTMDDEGCDSDCFGNEYNSTVSSISVIPSPKKSKRNMDTKDLVTCRDEEGRDLRYEPVERRKNEIQLMEEIIKDFIQQTSKPFLDQINEMPFRFVGICASTALLIQMKYSQTARKTIYQALQGSIALGLGGVAIGAWVSVTYKNRIFNWIYSSIHSEFEQKIEISPQPSIPKRRYYLDRHSFVLFKNWMSYLRQRLKHDEKLKKSYQGIIFVCILYFFRKKKKMILLSKRR